MKRGTTLKKRVANSGQIEENSREEREEEKRRKKERKRNKTETIKERNKGWKIIIYTVKERVGRNA